MTGGAIIGVRIGADGAPAFVLADTDIADPLAHHAAVVAELRRTPMAPLRFGALAPDLAVHAPALGRAAMLAADHVEIGVVLAAPMANACNDAARNGRGFLRRAAARERGAVAFAQAVDAVEVAIRVCAGVADVRRLLISADRVSLAICAQRTCAADVAAAAEALSNTAMSVDVSGPWPLYSFAREAA
jgi:Gas vesicle synthesis protein GvpL/GvpF